MQHELFAGARGTDTRAASGGEEDHLQLSCCVVAKERPACANGLHLDIYPDPEKVNAFLVKARRRIRTTRLRAWAAHDPRFVDAARHEHRRS